MELIHGADRTSVLTRIADRAERIHRLGATDEELRDRTDINACEEAEIAAARKLAAAWDRDEWLEAWHVWHVA